MSENQNKPLDTIGQAIDGLFKGASDVADQAGKLLNQGKDALANAIDVNGDGKIDVEDIIILGMRVPGVTVNRAEFLRAEFKKRYSPDIIEKAVESTPALAGISIEKIDGIANDVIAYERNCVSGISAALGVPGGLAMAATIPADIAQYYGFMLRAAQKLLYLYGFPQIDIGTGEAQFDSETMNLLTLCLGTMYGVAGANNAIKAVANALAVGVERQLLKKALTKGTIYPVVKSVAKWFGVNMTKKVFAGFFRKAIPVLGGVIGGAVTFVSFKPCCDQLKASLRDTILSNPDASIDPREIALLMTDQGSSSDTDKPQNGQTAQPQSEQ